MKPSETIIVNRKIIDQLEELKADNKRLLKENDGLNLSILDFIDTQKKAIALIKDGRFVEALQLLEKK